MPTPQRSIFLCGITCLIVIYSMGWLQSALAVQSLSDLYASRSGIQLQLNNLQKQLTSVRQSKFSVNGMKDATDMINSNGVTIPGLTIADITAMGDEALNQYQELTRYEKSLEMKLAVLQRSLELISVGISTAGQNANLKRFTLNTYGSAYITPNGTLYYIGLVNANGLNGAPTYVSDYTSTVPLKVDVSPLAGAGITQLYSYRDAFFLLSTKGELWTWGANYDGFGYSSATGYSGSSPILRKVDFGLATKTVVPKKIVCNRILLTGTYTNANPYCFMLSMDGELYFWGVRAWSYTPSGFAPGPAFNVKQARKVKITIGGAEKFASDFGLAENLTPTVSAQNSKPSFTVCVIDRGDPTSIYCLGDNSFGLLGDGTTTQPTFSTLETMMANSWSTVKKNPSADGEMFTQIYGAARTMYTVGSTGKLYTWGASTFNNYGSATVNSNVYLLGRNPLTESNTKIGKATFSNGFTTTKICSNPATDSIFLINESGYTYLLGSYNSAFFDTPYQPVQFVGKKFIDCDVNEDAQVILFSNGQTYAKGRNMYGQLMIGNSNADNTPTLIFAESFFPVFYTN